MSSQTISTRISDGLYMELNQFCLDKGVSFADVLKNALLHWKQFGDDNLPDFLLNKFKEEQADLLLKTKMKKVFFLHNIHNKIKRLVQYEGVEGDDIGFVLVPLIELYRDNAEVKGYTEAVYELNKVLKSYNGTTHEQNYFNSWCNLVPQWKGK